MRSAYSSLQVLSLCFFLSPGWNSPALAQEKECESALLSVTQELLAQIQKSIANDPYSLALSVKRLMEARHSARSAFPMAEVVVRLSRQKTVTRATLEETQQQIIKAAQALLKELHPSDSSLAGARDALLLINQLLQTQQSRPQSSETRFEASNKDTSPEPAKKQGPAHFAKSSVSGAKYWAMQRYGKIEFETGKGTTLKGHPSESPITVTAPTGNTAALTVFAEESEKRHGTITVPIPFGYVVSLHALQGARVVVDNQNRVLWAPGSSTQITLPLVAATNRSLIDAREYLQAPELLAVQLPAPLASALEALDGRGSAQFAEGATQAIAELFKYATTADTTGTVLERVHTGRFQCDTAATLLTWILRRRNIPARIVGGYFTDQKTGAQILSEIVLPLSKHAWVEAYIHGQWVVLDATPRGEGNQQQAPDQIPQDKPQPDPQLETQSNSEGVINQSELKEAIQREPQLLRPLLSELMAWATDLGVPLRARIDRIQKLTETAQSVRGSSHSSPLDALIHSPTQGLPLLLSHYNNSRRAAEANLHDELGAVLTSAPNRALTETVEKLQWFIRDIDLHLAWLRTEHPALAQLTGLRSQIVALRSQLIADPSENALAIRRTQEFFDNLPGEVSRAVLLERFAIQNSLAPGNAAKDVSDALLSGELQDYVLASQLAKSAWIPSEPVQLPRGRLAATWWPDSSDSRPATVLLPTEDPSQRSASFQLDKNLTEKSAWARGEKYILTRRQEMRLPDGIQNTQPSGALVILADVSPSMRGVRESYMIAWITALIDQALTQSKQIYILPFDARVGEPIEIRTLTDAQRILPQLRQNLIGTSAGTDITSALQAGATLIRAAADRGDQVLGRATLALISDGEDQVKAAEVEKIFDSLTLAHPHLKLSFGAVSVGSENPTIAQLAQRFEVSTGASFYLERSDAHVSQVVHDSARGGALVSAFWSDQTWQEVIQKQPDALPNYQRLLRLVFENRSPTWADHSLPTLTELTRSSYAIDTQAPLLGISSSLRVLPHLANFLDPTERNLLIRAVIHSWSLAGWFDLNRISSQDLGALEALKKWGTPL